ncbi:MAG: sensor histidine kinase [Thermoleophilia bacterium]
MRNNIFWSAKLKLSAFYTGSILLIVILFSLGVYVLFNRNIETDFGYQGGDSQQEAVLQQQLISQTRHRLLVTLSIVDLSTVALSVLLGWFLADNTLAPIQTALKRQKQFVSDAAHELSTPLSVMKAGLQTVERGHKPTTNDYRQLNTDLLEETNRLVDLTSDLLFLSRSDQPSLTAIKKTVNISSVCSKQLELLQAYAEQKGVHLSHTVQPNLFIFGDEGQIKRLVLNLLKNAVDYNKKDGESKLSLSKSGNEIILEVSDTGIGINQEDLKHVFKRFYKSDSARERSNSGTGLGLSIAKEIATFHQGKVHIESKVGEGTKVVVVFDVSKNTTG